MKLLFCLWRLSGRSFIPIVRHARIGWHGLDFPSWELDCWLASLLWQSGMDLIYSQKWKLIIVSLRYSLFKLCRLLQKYSPWYSRITKLRQSVIKPTGCKRMSYLKPHFWFVCFCCGCRMYCRHVVKYYTGMSAIVHSQLNNFWFSGALWNWCCISMRPSQACGIVMSLFTCGYEEK